MIKPRLKCKEEEQEQEPPYGEIMKFNCVQII